MNSLSDQDGRIVSLVLICCAVAVLASGCRKNEPISYAGDVQPILASKCYACHGPDGSEREAGLRLDIRDSLFVTLPSGNQAVSLEQPLQSELIRRITSDDPEYQMPPPDFPKPLEHNEMEVLKEWVTESLPWQNHWAFEPLKNVELPEVFRQRKARNPIDHFILSKQEELGLKPAQKADKRTLLRRLTFDLHGLPPTPEVLEAFLADKSEDAYERVVDRLLDSPRYGERWARHWLDVVHYAETHGYDKDQRRNNAWPYRDYVIDALNRDIPYGRFVEDQVAGDVLHPEDPASTVALGFLAAGPWDLVGHVEVKNGTVDKRIVRNLDRDDMVTTTMSTFTSMTVQCARCHDHKFDPISQREYYSLQAVFAGIDRADRPYHKDPALHLQRVNLKNKERDLEDTLDQLGKKLLQADSLRLTEILAQQTAARRQINRIRVPASPSNGYQSKVENSPNVEKWVLVDLGRTYSLDEIRLVPAFPRDGIPMPGYGFPPHFKIEGAASADFTGSLVLADFTKEAFSQRTDVPYVLSLHGESLRFIRVTATELWKGRGDDYFFALSELQAYADGQNVAFKKKASAMDNHDGDRWSVEALVDGYNSARGIDKGLETPASRRAIAEIEKKIDRIREEEQQVRIKPLKTDERKLLLQTQDNLDAVQDSLNALPEPEWVYAATNDFRPWARFVPPRTPRPIFLLNRGDTEQPLDELEPGTLSAMPGLDAAFDLEGFDLGEGHNEGARRAALAKWIVDRNNVLTWRSIVNRVWHYHFGQGLVSTPNDFGKMGGLPSHPELLDWLATAFLENGQSLKWLHRLIVTSAAYQQEVYDNKKYANIDGGNRYLWRANRRQLEAEAIRDAVLAVSGKLNLTVGGPGFDAFVYEDDHSPRYLYASHDPTIPTTFRRAIYRSVVRSVPDPFMTTLDCADPSQSVPVRNQTVTALQALASLNNPFMVQQAAYFAERLEAERNTVEGQVGRAFELALQRSPTEDERKTIIGYVENHGLAAACRLIFAMNEFLYID